MKSAKNKKTSQGTEMSELRADQRGKDRSESLKLR